MKIFLECPKCGKLTDIIPQLAASGAWDEGKGGLYPLFGEFMSTTIECRTPGCDGAWVLAIEEAEMRTVVHPEQDTDGRFEGKPVRMAVPKSQLQDGEEGR